MLQDQNIETNAEKLELCELEPQALQRIPRMLLTLPNTRIST